LKADRVPSSSSRCRRKLRVAGRIAPKFPGFRREHSRGQRLGLGDQELTGLGDRVPGAHELTPPADAGVQALQGGGRCRVENSFGREPEADVELERTVAVGIDRLGQFGAMRFGPCPVVEGLDPELGIGADPWSR
jgi:hypothetical protein